MPSTLFEQRLLDSFAVRRTYRVSDRVMTWLRAIVDEYSSDTPIVGSLTFVSAMLLIDAVNFSKSQYTFILLSRSENSDEIDDRELTVRNMFTRIGMKFILQRDLYGNRFFHVEATDFVRGFYRSMLLYRQITKFGNPVQISNIISQNSLKVPYYEH